MKKTFLSVKAYVLCATLAFAMTAFAFGQNAAPLNLGGQSFKLDLVDTQNNITHDMLSFKETSFTCNAISNSTYTATRYAVTKQADGRLFLYAIAISETEGTITWKGHIEAGKLKGSMLTDKPGHPMSKLMLTGDSRLNTESEK